MSSSIKMSIIGRQNFDKKMEELGPEPLQLSNVLKRRMGNTPWKWCFNYTCSLLQLGRSRIPPAWITSIGSRWD